MILLVLIGFGAPSSSFASEHIANSGDPAIQIEIGDVIDDRGLRPITITQIFSDAKNLNSIQIYDFGLDNENQWSDQHSQESLPNTHRIFEIYGKKSGDSTLTEIKPELVDVMNYSQISYTMNCKYMNSTIHTNSEQTYKIPNGFSKIMVKQSNVGILPTDLEFRESKQYLFHLASFYKQKIIAPENSFHTMYSDEKCDIDFQGFKIGYYSDLSLIFVEDSSFFREGIQSNDGKIYPLLVGKEAVIVVDLKEAYDNPNATSVRTGYAIEQYNGTDIIPHPPGSDASREEQTEFAMSIPKYIDSFHKTATFKDHQDFDINSELPQRAMFSFVPPEVGHYSFSKYVTSFPSEFPDSSSSQRSFIVVEEQSKALREYGQCKSFELRPVAKPDYSNVVCVTANTSIDLKQRGWH